MNTETIDYLTVDQVAAILNMSPDSVSRKFGDRDGVIDVGSAETLHKRRRRILRIPRSALDRFIAEHQVQVRRR
jgi:hypothetical protein